MLRCPKCGYLTNDKTAFDKHVANCGKPVSVQLKPAPAEKVQSEIVPPAKPKKQGVSLDSIDIE